MNLNLKRPLVFFDLETTGINISMDRIVEISLLKILPDQTESTYTYRINPERPIPLESSLIHKIYDEDVKDAVKFKDVAQEIADILESCDLGGYNSNKFDIPLLMEEFLRAGIDFSLENRSFIDVQNIFHQMEQRTLKAAYRFYCDQDLNNAHSAEADVRATYEVLKAQLERYEGVEWESKSGERSKPVVNDIEALHTFTNLSRPVDFAGRVVYNEDGEEIFSFGKHKGTKVAEVFSKEPSYYAWMMNGEFPLYTKKCLKTIWERTREQIKKSAGQEATGNPGAKEATRPDPARPAGKSHAPKSARTNSHTGGPSNSTGRPRNDKPSGPITDDMLEGLKNKFGK